MDSEQLKSFLKLEPGEMFSFKGAILTEILNFKN